MAEWFVQFDDDGTLNVAAKGLDEMLPWPTQLQEGLCQQGADETSYLRRVKSCRSFRNPT